MKTLQLFLLGIFVSLSCVNSMAQTNYYVKTATAGSGDGSSWMNATTLSSALATSVSGDIIHIAAGTYTPTLLITNGVDDLEKTFEIKNNVTLIGGYPADPIVTDVPGSENETLLSGNVGEGLRAYHVVAITAPVEDGKKVVLQGLSIKHGQALGTATFVTINGVNYLRNQGGAIIIAKSTVELNNCIIADNNSLGHTPGVYVFMAANVTINDCLMQNNIGVGNAGALWNEGSTVYINNSNILNNKVSGVSAGMQLITSSKTYVYNTTIANNIVGMNGETSRSAGGIYVRNGSVATFVNCTVYGNEGSGNGGGICTHGTGGTKAIIINSTISKNKSTNGGGGIYNNSGCNIDIYNSIVADNTGKLAADFDLGGSVGITKSNSIATDKVYDSAGVEVADKLFIASTMLDLLNNNGGDTKTCKLLLDEATNPAKTMGMSSASLVTLGGTFTPVIPESVIAYDQLGNSRGTYASIGAWVINGILSSSVPNQTLSPMLYISDGSVYVTAKQNDLITVYSITGQQLYLTKAKSTLTKIDALSSGNVYIVKVNDKSRKVVL